MNDLIHNASYFQRPCIGTVYVIETDKIEMNKYATRFV